MSRLITFFFIIQLTNYDVDGALLAVDKSNLIFWKLLIN